MSNENNIPAAVEETAAVAENPVEENPKAKKKRKKKEDDYTNPNNRKFRILPIVCGVIAAILIAFLATFCFVGNTWFVHTEINDPEYATSTYTDEQKEQAAEAVVKFFGSHQQGSILQEVNYSEKFSQRFECLSFEGRFYAIFSGIDSVKAPGENYKNWHWDLKLNPETNEFEVVQYGVLKDLTVVGEEGATEASE